jgi:hypothetical protein
VSVRSLHAWRVAAQRRRTWQVAARVAAWALPGAMLAALALAWAGVPRVPSLLVGGTVAALAGAWWARHALGRTPLATVLEARVPESRNLLATALPLAERAVAAPTGEAAPGDAAQSLVVERAAALACTLDVRQLFPVSAGPLAGGACVAAVLLVASLRVTPASRPRDVGAVDALAARGTTAPTRAPLGALRVVVVPPAYLARAEERLDDPRRLVVPEGSNVRVSVEAPIADSVLLEAASSTFRFTRAAGDARVRATAWRADSDAVLVVRAHHGDVVTRRFLGVTVVPDAAPRVRITAPGRDLVLPRGDTTLQLAIEADDDHALGALALRYTRVSGSGERYTFDEGTLPLTIARRAAGRWEARVAWPLDSLTLGPGDIVVYRAIAADRRPGAPLVESDAWIAEVAAGRGDGAAGFAVDVGELRYALSQQMIVLRIERLLAARDSLGAALTPESLAERARLIATEQRRVRAEFVFLMGGELAEEVTAGDVMGDLNEHQHTEVEADLSAGRVRNEGRAAVFAAIRAMSRVSTALGDTALRPALGHARDAVAQLEVAFSRARFLMRPLVEREAIDPARRLTGTLAGVSGSSQPVSPVPPRADVAAWRAALDDVQQIAGAPLTATDADSAAVFAARLEQRAAELLRAGASSPDAQVLVVALGEAADAVRRGDIRARATALDAVAVRLVSALVRAAPAASTGTRTPRMRQLDAVLTSPARP